MKALIKNEIQKIKDEYDFSSVGVKVYFYLGIRLFSLGRNYLISRYYLRKANKLGKLVFTKRKPDVVNHGHLEIGNLVRIWSSVNRCRLSVSRGGKLTIGDNTRLNGPTISASSEVRIGKNCRIAPHTIIMDGDFHDTGDRLSAGKSAAIIIEDDAWLATRSMVLKGVTVGKGAVVAAGAVVTKDVEPYTVVAGIPAKVVKRITPPVKKEEEEVLETAE